MEQSASFVGDIALPVTHVRLTELKQKSGEGVLVKVESIDQLTIARIAGLPGTSPQPTERVFPVDSGVETVEKLIEVARPLIERATSLLDADGSEVRPAFYFDENFPRHPKSIPGRLLGVKDVSDLCIAILRISGFVGGASDEATFHDGERTGDENSAGS